MGGGEETGSLALALPEGLKGGTLNPSKKSVDWNQSAAILVKEINRNQLETNQPLNIISRRPSQPNHDLFLLDFALGPSLAFDFRLPLPIQLLSLRHPPLSHSVQLSPTSKKGTLSSGLEICLASSNDVVLEIITATFESRISNFAHCRSQRFGVRDGNMGGV